MSMGVKVGVPECIDPEGWLPDLLQALDETLEQWTGNFRMNKKHLVRLKKMNWEEVFADL